MKKTDKTMTTFSKESMVKAFTENKIFYLYMVGVAIDAVNGTSVTKEAHLAKISFAEVFFHEENFAMWCARDFVKVYGNKYTTEHICTSDYEKHIGDVQRTFTTLTWRDSEGEIVARVQVNASHMRECDLEHEGALNYIVHP